MAKGTSQTQSTSSATSRPGVSAPRGSAAATAGMRRRRLTGGSNSSAGGVSASPASPGNNMLRFYTDEAPGLKITPTAVLIMTVCFIGFVTTLHILGKIYRAKTGSGM